jgi:ParB family chromosome partitioning protein
MDKIALDEIKVLSPYLRTNTDIESLKKSIEAIGLINPLTINEKNELLAGGRRYQALKELGKSEALVRRVNLTTLEQELISVDENLVRTPLNKIEFEKCLNRGREIYEELNPTAIKVKTETKALTPEEKRKEKEEEESDTTSFAAVTAEKTGLSKAVIKKAIQRDELSSSKVKEARGAGEITASQVNEIIQLDKSDQDKLLDHIKDKPVKEVRKIVKTARSTGLDAAIEESENILVIPREFTQLEAACKKANKLLQKVIIENIDIEASEIKTLIKQVENMQKQSKDFLELFSNDFDYIPPSAESESVSHSVQ